MNTQDTLNVDILRKDFPFLQQLHGNNPLCYVDNAATTQKPQMVLDAMMRYYRLGTANIYRSVYTRAEEVTQEYERIRMQVALFIGACHVREVIFTRGTTEGINLVAYSWGLQHVKAGDEIVITQLEHHANILPWMRLVQQIGARLVTIPVKSDGMLDLSHLERLITTKTKLVALTQVSNVLGTHVDIQKIISYARSVDARILIDGAQSVPHQQINVQELDCDFFVFSGHKMLGPEGIGVLYIKEEMHEQMIPYLLGGGMVQEIKENVSLWQKMPHIFEAGTQSVGQVIGLGAAIEYLSSFSFDTIRMHEAQLCSKFIDGLHTMPRVRILGPVNQLKNKGHLVSFVIDRIHAHDAAAYLDTFGICVRAGNHCAQPLAYALNYDACVRVSFYIYNTLQEVDYLLCKIDSLCQEMNCS